MLIDLHSADLDSWFAGLPPRPYNSQLRPFRFINTDKPSMFQAIAISANMSTGKLSFLGVVAGLRRVVVGYKDMNQDTR